MPERAKKGTAEEEEEEEEEEGGGGGGGRGGEDCLKIKPILVHRSGNTGFLEGLMQ